MRKLSVKQAVIGMATMFVAGALVGAAIVAVIRLPPSARDLYPKAWLEAYRFCKDNDTHITDGFCIEYADAVIWQALKDEEWRRSGG